MLDYIKNTINLVHFHLLLSEIFDEVIYECNICIEIDHSQSNIFLLNTHSKKSKYLHSIFVSLTLLVHLTPPIMYLFLFLPLVVQVTICITNTSTSQKAILLGSRHFQSFLWHSWKVYVYWYYFHVVLGIFDCSNHKEMFSVFFKNFCGKF